MKKLISIMCVIALFSTFLTMNAFADGNLRGFRATNIYSSGGDDIMVVQAEGDYYPFNSFPLDETLYLIAHQNKNIRIFDFDQDPERKMQMKSMMLIEKEANESLRHDPYFYNVHNIWIVNDDYKKITYIGNESFIYNTRLKDIYIPDSVTEFGKNVFNEQTNPVIHCTNGSAAMKYALENNHAFDAEGYEGIAGDLDCDDSINMNDVLTLRKYIAGIRTKVNINATDVNGDGTVNIKDVLKLRKLIAGIE